MCGIVGYNGDFDSRDLTLKCLSNLEYRGYDSCGIAFFDENGNNHIVKTTGRVSNLVEKITNDNTISGLKSNCCIAHTRWATHGGVTDVNAHPHEVGNTVLIHNGIIDNYASLIHTYNLKNCLKSETDSEVACQVLEYTRNRLLELKKTSSKVTDSIEIEAIKRFVYALDGTFTFLITFKDLKDEIFAVRRVSPLVVGKNDNACFLGSDIAGLISLTKTFYTVPENVIIHIKDKNFTAYDINKDCFIDLEPYTVDWDMDSAKKDGYPHYMLKEIYEQPDVIEKTYTANYDKCGNQIDTLKKEYGDMLFKKIQIVACGTALHAGMVAANVFKGIIKIPIETYIASEYRYSDNLTNNKTLVIIISQSGETIDSLESLRIARLSGAKIVSIVNVKGSSIDRESDISLYTHAGPEIAVASTKAYTCQIALLYCFFIHYGKAINRIDDKELNEFNNSFRELKNDLIDTLNKEPECKKIVSNISYFDNCFYIGRGIDYISSLEGALKLKEISYIHTEAYAAGELKHGTIALISDKVPVIAIDTDSNISIKTLSNVREVKARGAKVILIISEELTFDNDNIDCVIKIKNVNKYFRLFLVSIITQLIAYHTSVKKGLDVDKPRNLAKSVTVE